MSPSWLVLKETFGFTTWTMEYLLHQEQEPPPLLEVPLCLGVAAKTKMKCKRLLNLACNFSFDYSKHNLIVQILALCMCVNGNLSTWPASEKDFSPTLFLHLLLFADCPCWKWERFAIFICLPLILILFMIEIRNAWHGGQCIKTQRVSWGLATRQVFVCIFIRCKITTALIDQAFHL